MKNWFKKIGEKISGKKSRKISEKESVSKFKDPKPSLAKVKIPKMVDPKPSPAKVEIPKMVDPKPSPAKVEIPKMVDPKPSPAKVEIPKVKETKTNWFNKLGDNFKRTSLNIKNAIFAKKISLDDLLLLEEAFLMSDLGVSFTEELINDLKKKKIENGNLKNEVVKILESQFQQTNNNFVFKKNAYPQVVLFFGVNGSGKTTTLVKLANKAKSQGLKIKIIAADTFRAAAVEQLEEWSSRLKLDIFTGSQNEDPSSVVFKGHKEAIENNIDVLLIDTAGRLHNKSELMEELKKIVRTIQKNDAKAPHNKLLVLDSTIGQNTYSQLEAFDSSVGITGVIMTKLDSSSKGGSLIGISKKYKTPIHFIGVGEKSDDLIDFNAKDFINALIGNNFGDKSESIH
ncbi:MAG: Signal recognition particle receptor FtsY [Alphaproteobacteria bacterium MarineAlpha9_Bin4]|nr:MAG: Signal recognition particle receptor FtsY [Alphaproteobacteria bacterium MarineAlpha9_Bin4]